MRFLAILLLLFGCAHAQQQLALSMVVGDEWVVQLDDDSCWAPQLVETKKQSWSEWWEGDEPEQFDDNFFFDPSTWSVRDRIRVSEAPTGGVPGCPYVIENLDRGERVFASLCRYDELLIPKESVADLFDHLADFIVVRNVTLCGHPVLTLNDGSFWGLYQVGLNSQTWREWWHGVEPDQPDPSFLLGAQTWATGTSVELHAVEWDETTASRSYQYYLGDRSQATFLLRSSATSAKAFAYPFQTSQVVDLFMRHAEAEYSRGYSSGYSSGFCAGRLTAPRYTYH